MNAPPQLYMIGLLALMKETGVDRVEYDLETVDLEMNRGLSLNVTLDGAKVTISQGRCLCPKCLAVVGSGTQ